MTPRFGRARVEALGFTGWQSAAELARDRARDVTSGPGVYAVVRPSSAPPVFLERSCGGWFEGLDPTVDRVLLQAAWVVGTDVLYIDKAGTSLRVRVRALVDFGAGKPVGHRGGSYLWQLSGCDLLLVGWLSVDDPSGFESRLLADFEAAHGRLPFANRVH